MRVHALKCWPESFAAILAGTKRYEVRKDDRGYMVGDTLRLREYEPDDDTENDVLLDDSESWEFDSVGDGAYTGRELLVRITYKTPGGSWGLPSEVCVLGVEPCDKPEVSK